MKDIKPYYDVPTMWLPYNSKLPLKIEGTGVRVTNEIRQEIVRAIQQIEEVKFRAVNYSVSRQSLNHEVDSILYSIRKLNNLLGGQPKSASEKTRDTSNLTQISLALAEEGKNQDFLVGYAIYDKYFQVIRKPNMEFLDVLRQIGRTAEAILFDLPFVSIDIGELIAIIDFLSLSFDWAHYLVEEKEFSISRVGSIDSEIAESSLWEEAWKAMSTNPGEWTKTVSGYRWKVGHHLFNMASVFAFHYFRSAAASIVNRQLTTGLGEIRKASRALRSTTAAMWYAANMPRYTYKHVIRPSMQSQQTPHGFSGDQNAEFNRVKASISELEQQIFSSYSEDHRTWPDPLKEAVIQFVHDYVLDGEAHTLIAAAMTGTDQSISQHKGQQFIPDERKKNALDLLREIYLKRRQAFGNIPSIG